MAATLPAGLLERMIGLTESLLASLGDKNVPIASAAVSGHENIHENATHIERVSGQSEVTATSMVFTSLAPADICSNYSLRLRRSSGGSCSADGTVLTSSRHGSGSVREVRGLDKKSPVELDTIRKHGQVM
jgi:hypothetical protein